jgi:hypothetical protein
MGINAGQSWAKKHQTQQQTGQDIEQNPGELMLSAT